MSIKDFLDVPIFGSLLSDDTETVGIGGFDLEVRVRDNINFTSTAPTSYVEDGSFINDHIILDPTIFTIEGEVSDIVIKPNRSNNIFKSDLPNIATFTQFLPSRTQSELQNIESFVETASDTIDKLDSISNINNVYDLLQGTIDGLSPQRSFFQFIKTIHESKLLITIQTMYGTFSNFRIVSSSLSKVDDNYTTYSLALQQIRFATTETTTIAKDASNPTGDASTQTQGTSNKGTVQGSKVGEEKERSFLSTIIG